MRAAPLIPPAPGKTTTPAPLSLAEIAPLSTPAPPAAASAAPTPSPAAGALPAVLTMDRDFILRNQIVERYIAGRLSLKGAQEFERYCANHPELIEELGIADRVHSGLRLLDSSRVALPWEPKPRRWWEHPAVLVLSLTLVAAALVAALVLDARVIQRDATIKGLHTQLRDQPIDPATSTHNVPLEPSRTAPSRRNAIVLGGGAEMADFKIDMSWSKFTAFRVTVDRMDQGRVMVLHNVLRDSNGDLHISINTSALGPGSYQFAIEGLTLKSEAFAQAWVTVGLTR
jgi:hypothetical protein